VPSVSSTSVETRERAKTGARACRVSTSSRQVERTQRALEAESRVRRRRPSAGVASLGGGERGGSRSESAR